MLNTELQTWLDTPAGQALVQQEKQRLRSVLPAMFGHRLVQIGSWGFAYELFECAETLRQWIIAPRGDPHADVVFDGQSLPLTSKCLDAVILPHSLEFSPSPHHLLREVDRVLCDHGQLFVMGFNPWSPWAGTQWLHKQHKRYPAAAKLHSLKQVKNWLGFLDYEILSSGRHGAGFPYLPGAGIELGHAGWRRLPAMFAQAYWVHARKRIVRLTPLTRPVRKRKLVGDGIPEPTRRNTHCAQRREK